MSENISGGNDGPAPKGKSGKAAKGNGNGNGNGSEPPAAPASVFDNLEALRIQDEGPVKRKEKRLLAIVGTKRPSEAHYFRVHPDEEMSWLGFVYTYEKDSSNWYVLPGPPYDEMTELTSKLRRVRLFLCITRRGSLTFWLVSQTDQGTWGSSARETVEFAKTCWIRVVSNRDEGCYEPREPEEQFPEPEWPDKSLSELLKLAFKGRVIDRPDHPIIEELKGRDE
jgi:hypothetical protein